MEVISKGISVASLCMATVEGLLGKYSATTTTYAGIGDELLIGHSLRQSICHQDKHGGRIDGVRSHLLHAQCGKIECFVDFPGIRVRKKQGKSRTLTPHTVVGRFDVLVT